MNAGDVMTRNVITVTPETTVPDLVTILLSRNISGVPVVDADGRLVGIVAEADLVRRSELGTERKTVRRWLRLGHSPSLLACRQTCGEMISTASRHLAGIRSVRTQ